MQLYHCSPEKITHIYKSELFGDILFFSSDQYSLGESKCTYLLQQDADTVIAECHLENAEIAQQISEALDVDIETAEGYLCGSDLAEDGWYIQRMQGECCIKMGYQAVESTDEQGAVWIIPMSGRLTEMRLI